MNNFPFTADDLRLIADRLEFWNKALVDESNQWVAEADLVDSIVVTRPNWEGEVIGKFTLQDEWVGFIFGGMKS